MTAVFMAESSLDGQAHALHAGVTQQLQHWGQGGVLGFAASVANGRPEVLSRVHLVTQASGGKGAVREICDFILRAQGTYEAALAPYLS